MKTVVLGFDALDFHYLDRFENHLPNIRRVRESGVEAPLRSTHPPWTGSAWPSMYTGTDPSYHGVYGFFEYDGYPDRRTHVSRLDVHQPAIWDYLSNEGPRSIVVNVPVTHPAEPIEGILIPGYLAPEDEPGHPDGIRDELSDAIGEEYTIYSSDETNSNLEAKFRGYLELIDKRRRGAVALLERHEWELAVFQVQKTDAVFHHYEDERRFLEVYRAADRFVGDVLDVVDDANVVLCSDHGIGPVTGYQINVNELLREHGFVEPTTDGGESTGGIDKRKLVDVESDVGEQEPGRLERTIGLGRKLAFRLGITPADVYSGAQRVGLGDTLVELTPDALRATAVNERVDWRTSRAYCEKGSRMGVRVNLSGREPNGVVPQTAYEDVRDELVSLLSSLETPDGESAFEFVCRREKLYDGPFIEDAPDVCFLPSGMDHTVSHALFGRQFIPVEKHDHKPEGVFIGAGPGFSPANSIDRLSLTDVAPITMGLLGRPVPERMTGSVPPGVLTLRPDRRSYHGVQYGTGETELTPDDGEVTERLEDLGYL